MLLPVLEERLDLGDRRLRSVVGGTGSPAEAAHSRNARWESKPTPSAAPNECTHRRSGRDAVTFGSFWRSDPAAALRGFANAFWPASCSSLVQRFERLHREVHLAADLDHRRRIVEREPMRHPLGPCGRWR